MHGCSPSSGFVSGQVRASGVSEPMSVDDPELAALLEHERRRNERLAVVTRVARLVSTNLHLDDLLRRAADAIHEVLGFPNIGLALIEPDDPATMIILGPTCRICLRRGLRMASRWRTRASGVATTTSTP